MAEFDIYKDIAERTQGDIYVGVVGPVRTGKSTFIRRFMELLVIPNISNSHKKERAKDTLPQSGSGRTITTVEPKFIPNEEAVEIELNDNARMRVRLVDCVGYMVNGATGHIENDQPRMVKTPWFEEEIPFIKAAEIGTRKVITDHSTIGLVVTTDGSITDIPREGYIEAEERVIGELQSLKKPFIVLLNTVHPYAPDTINLRKIMEEKYSVPVYIIDALNMKLEDINNIMEKVLYEFPIREVGIKLPDWVEVLDNDHWLKKNFIVAIKNSAPLLNKIRDIKPAVAGYKQYEFVGNINLNEIKLGEGTAIIDMNVKDGLFFNVLGEICGYDINGEHGLLSLMKELTVAKREYDKVAEALREVRETGYGMVPPQMDELKMEEPEIVRQGNRFGVKLRASAPSLHIIRANVETEVSPIVGTESQGEELVKSLVEEFERDPQKVWQLNMFGKTLEDIVKEGLQTKLAKMPDDIQEKLQRTLQKIINEGNGGLICIIL
ncbi:stage IV sporulation protein A [Fonticella tunisiensis]|uniref:stage IV sporulation protein A n=1 Tax=Fonticella tunisiensis TaxID=1096341 RepID=UPI00105F1206|nr:stage IV sporulation protein A [Fonticella tunisiensis]